MNTIQASKKWNITKETVQNYCKDGLIPNVYKEKNKWIIPDNAKKPPFGKKQLLIFLDNLLQIKHGASSTINNSFSKKEILKAYQYLSQAGFITSFDINIPFESNIKNLDITPRGKEIIKKSLEKNLLKGKISINLGFLSAEISND